MEMNTFWIIVINVQVQVQIFIRFIMEILRLMIILILPHYAYTIRVMEFLILS